MMEIQYRLICLYPIHCKRGYLLVLHKTLQYYVTADIMLRCHGYLQGIID